MLERKAKALLLESTEMAELARNKMLEAEQLAGVWGWGWGGGVGGWVGGGWGGGGGGVWWGG